MREFIEKVFSNQQIKLDDLSKFIIEYAELCGLKNTTPQHVQFALQMIQQGMFDLNYACKNCASKLGLQVVEMKDENGNLMYIKIQD